MTRPAPVLSAAIPASAGCACLIQRATNHQNVAKVSFVRFIGSRRKRNPHFLRGHNAQANFVRNQAWLDAQFAYRNRAGGEFPKDMGGVGRDKSNHTMRKNRFAAPLMHWDVTVRTQLPKGRPLRQQFLKPD